MDCLKPIIVKRPLSSGDVETLEFECGKCVVCQQHRRNDWVFRLSKELEYHEEACFLTLTYADEHLPQKEEWNSPRPLQLFFKRFRKAHPGVKIKYFAVSEYGSNTFRLHYHICLFGWSEKPENLIPIRGDENNCSSTTIQRLWPFGFNTCSPLDKDGIRYATKYVMKGNKQALYNKLGYPRPIKIQSHGLGKRWCLENATKLIAELTVTVGKYVLRLPRYFRKLLKERFPYAFPWEDFSLYVREKHARFTADYGDVALLRNISLAALLREQRIRAEELLLTKVYGKDPDFQQNKPYYAVYKENGARPWAPLRFLKEKPILLDLQNLRYETRRLTSPFCPAPV